MNKIFFSGKLGFYLEFFLESWVFVLSSGTGVTFLMMI